MYNIQKREIAIWVLISLVTCGIGTWIWVYNLNEDARTVSGEEGMSGALVIVLSLVTCGLFLIYWMYKLGEQINAGKARAGQTTDSNLSILYLILSLVGLSIVSLALAQNELNKLAQA